MSWLLLLPATIVFLSLTTSPPESMIPAPLFAAELSVIVLLTTVITAGPADG